MKLFETLSTYHKTSTNNVTLRGFFPHFLLRFQNGQRIDISSELIKCIQIKKRESISNFKKTSLNYVGKRSLTHTFSALAYFYSSVYNNFIYLIDKCILFINS